AEAMVHPPADLAGQRQEVAGGGRPAVGGRQCVLAPESRRSGAAVALGEAGSLDQPGGAGLHTAVGLRPGGRTLGHGGGGDDRGGEERTRAPGGGGGGGGRPAPRNA